MESLAEYYSAELSQKLRRGQRESALKCHSLGGYHALGLTSNKNHEFVIDETQAPTVRYIFQQYAAGQSSAAIVADLNAKGKRTATGGAFNKNSIMRIVTNEQYIGTYTSKAHDVRVENAIPAIIDRELWDKVQAMVKINRAGRAPHTKRANYMLSGKLFCKLCDNSMISIHPPRAGWDVKVYKIIPFYCTALYGNDKRNGKRHSEIAENGCVFPKHRYARQKHSANRHGNLCSLPLRTFK